MNVSGILVACRPEHLGEVQASLGALPWAEVHYTEANGRMVVTIEADSTRQSMDRLTHVKTLPRVLLAEMAEYRVGTSEG